MENKVSNKIENDIRELLCNISNDIIPNKNYEDEILKKVEFILDKIRYSAKKLKYDVSVELGGSAAKRTFLLGDFDCDVFVRFNYDKYSEEDSKLSLYLKNILKNIDVNFVELHGSRNYFQFVYDDIKFEIVPVLLVNNIKMAKNITDSSPFHVSWFNEKCKNIDNEILIKDELIDKNYLKLNNQVRLAKIFVKSSRCYGAESYISGFSGHVIDILISYFNDFLGFVNFFAFCNELLNLKKYDEKKILIDVSNFYNKKNTIEVQKLLNESKIDSPIIVIDPISPERNAASALSLDKFNLFVRYCKKFISKPDKSFFIMKKFSDEMIISRIKELEIENLPSNAIICKVEPLLGKKDVVGAKIKKISDYIKKKLVENSFIVFDYDFELIKKKDNKVSVNDSEDFSESYLWFFVDKRELDKEFIWLGPPIKEKVHAEVFKNKHISMNNEVFEKDGKLYAKIKRKFISAKKYLEYLKDDIYIKEKCKNISVYKIF